MKIYLYLTFALLFFANMLFAQVEANDDFVYMSNSSTIQYNVLANDLNANGYIPVVSNVPTGVTVTVNADGTLNITANSTIVGNYYFDYTIGNCCPRYVEYLTTQSCSYQQDCISSKQVCTTTTSEVQVTCPAGSGAVYCTGLVIIENCITTCDQYSAPYQVCYPVVTPVYTDNLCQDGTTERVCETARVNLYITQATKDLSIAKTVEGSSFIVGDTVTFNIEVKNENGLTVSGVNSVLDTLNASQFQYISHSASEGTYLPATGEWTLSSFSGGSVKSLEIKAVILSEGLVENCAYLSSTQDTKFYNNESCIFILGTDSSSVGSCDICSYANYNITKNLDSLNTGPFFPGDTLRFVLEASTLGGDTAYNVVVNDLLRNEFIFESAVASQGSYNASTGNWIIGELVGSETLVITARLRNLGEEYVENIATISSSSIDTNITANASLVEIQLNDLASDLFVEKSVENVSISGDTVLFEIVVVNLGPSIATDVMVTDNFPSNMELVSSMSTSGSYNTSTHVWDLGNIAVNDTHSLSILAFVVNGSVVNNDVVLTSNTFDYNPINNVGFSDYRRHLCTDTSGYVFEIDPIFGATYSWTVPSGFVIESGALTNRIVVKAGSSPLLGEIKVVVSTDCFVDTASISISSMDCECTNYLTVDAGVNQAVCSGSDIHLSTASVIGDFSTIYWVSSGSGGFNDDRILKPIYTPSSEDIENGIVTLTLHVVNSDTSLSCFDLSDNVTIELIATPNFVSSSSLNPSYCGSMDGEYILSGLLPFQNFNVSFEYEGVGYGPMVVTSTQDSLLVLENLGAGLYSNIVIENNGCETYPDNFSLVTTQTFSVSRTIDHPSSCTSSDGVITFSGLVPNTSYEFSYTYLSTEFDLLLTSNGDGKCVLSGLESGVYSLMQFRNDDCFSNILSATLFDPGAPVVTVANVTAATNCTSANGSLSFVGLVPNTDYVLSYVYNGVVDSLAMTSNSLGEYVLGGLFAGSYSNIIFENLDFCNSNTLNATVGAPSLPFINNIVVANATGCNSSFYNGSLTIKGTGILAQYYKVLYTFNGVDYVSANIYGSTTNGVLLSGLQPGVYTNVRLQHVTSGCTSNSMTATILQPDLSDVIFVNATTPSICGGSNGSANFSGLPISLTFTVSYKKNGINQANLSVTSSALGEALINNLTAGVYSDVVFSYNGCESAPLMFEIGNPNLIVSFSGVNPTTCTSNTGRINISTTRNSTSYVVNYLKDGIPTSVTLTSSSTGVISILNLAPGNYTNISITENGNLGCTSNIGSVVLTRPGTTPSISLSAIANPTQCSTNSGFIIIQTNSTSVTNFNLRYDSLGVTVNRTISSFADGRVIINNLYAGFYSNIMLAVVPSTTCFSNTISTFLSDPSGLFISVDEIQNTCNLPSNNGALLIGGMQPNSNYLLSYVRTLLSNGTVTTVSNVSIQSNSSGQYLLSNLVPAIYSQLSIFNSLNSCRSNSISGTVNVSEGIDDLFVLSTSASLSCSVNNGKIVLANAEPFSSYTVNYSFAGQGFTKSVTSNANGVIVLNGLSAGSYSNISLSYGNGCSSNLVSAIINGPEAPKLYHIGCE